MFSPADEGTIHNLRGMWLTSISVLFLAAVVLSGPVLDKGPETGNYVFENEIMEILEELRKLMKEGDPEAGIPKLDPLNWEMLRFDFSLLDTELAGYLKSGVASNLSDFEVLNLELNLLPSIEFRMNVRFDQLQVAGLYKLNGVLLGDYAIDGIGCYRVTPKDVIMSARVKLEFKAGLVQVDEIDLNFDIKKIKVVYTNQKESREEKEFEEEFVLGVLKRVQEKYIPPLLNTLKVVLNDLIERLKLEELLDRYTKEQFSWNAFE